MNHLCRTGIAIAVLSGLAGCASEVPLKPRPFTPAIVGDSHADPEKAFPTNPGSGVDQAGGINPNVSARPRHETPPPATPTTPDDISDVIRQNVHTLGPSMDEPPATSRSTTASTTLGISSGEYLTLGGVVAEVNGTPIYANKVLADIQPILAADAKEMGENEFREAAKGEIRKAVDAMIDSELEYAAAERTLDQKDKQLAELMTTAWRQEQINVAGGSIEMARQRALAVTGQKFETLVQDQYRVNMRRIYMRQKIAPRIVVTAQDERNYYDQNLATEFTDPAAIRFKLIKIDVEKAGGHAQAMKKISELRDRIANAGESFEAIAHSVNDDERLRASGGDLGTAIQKGAFAIEPVEKAAWNTPVGQITPVIDAGNALYIAKVEDKKEAHVSQFDQQDVQERIYRLLSTQQFVSLQKQAMEKLLNEAILRTDNQMAQTALDMAMQNYHRWAGH